MNDCRRIESLLPPYVDGTAAPEHCQAIDAHLRDCVVCRAHVEAERLSRAVRRARGLQLGGDAAAAIGVESHARREAPPRAARARSDARPAAKPSRRPRVAASAAVILLPIATAIGFEFLSPESNVLFAAQLAIDHVRCFIVEQASVGARDAGELQRAFASGHGWSVTIPPSNAAIDLTLVAARRCPFWVGDHAHLMYRLAGHEISLYVTPGAPRAAGNLHVLGHAEHIWSARGASYALVADDLPAATLDQVAEYLRQRTR